MLSVQPPFAGATTAEIERCYNNAVEHFLNSVGEVFALIDRDGRVLRANIAYRRLTGPAGGAHDASILFYIEPERREACREAIQALGDGQPARSLQFRFRIGNQLTLIDAEFAWLGLDGLIGFVGRDVTCQDTLERERIETATERDAVEQIGNIGHWRAGKDLQLRWSAGAALILGIDAAAPPMMLNDFATMIVEEDRPSALATARETYEKRRPLSATFKLRRPDGTLRVIQVAGAPSLDGRGQVEALHGVIVDKTDAYAALQAVMNADTTVRRFVQSAPMSVAMYDKEMRLLMGSRSYFRDAGLPEEQMLGRCIYNEKLWLPEKWRAIHRQVLRGETLRHDRDRFEGPDGKAQWRKWSCAPWRDANGEIGGLVSMQEDVTDVVNAQHEIEASRERMTFGLAMTSTMIWEIDFEKTELHLEGDWTHFFPQRPNFDSFTGGDAWMHPADREVLASKWRAHLAGGPPYTVDYRVLHPTGREQWHNLSIRVLKSIKGQPARAFGVVQDITGRKQVESKAMVAEQRALVAGAVKADFLSNMSHEIRTPLNGVLAVSEVLSRTPLEDRQYEMVRLIATSGRALLRVMDDLVEFSRLEGDQIEFDVRPFELEDIIRQACEAARARAEAKGLKFNSFISATVDGVYRGDAVRINQVMGNLLNNAVKFTDAGSINVSASCEELARNAAMLKVTITDTGVGFAPALAERIFERFEQADLSTSRKYGGLGLGLSIVKRLVEMMKGTISATSKEGEGSTFQVTIPLSRDRIAALGALSAIAVEDFDAETRIGNLRLLVAEDNPMNRRVVELLLAGSATEVIFAENGQEAVSKFAERKYDLVLMDLQMPVMGGLAATKAIREWEAANNKTSTPIIAVSANATASHVLEAKEAGADDHVAKPIVRETLFEAIARNARTSSGSAHCDDLDFNLDDLEIAI